MPRPLFEFFEMVAEELSISSSKVITHDDLRIEEENSPLLQSLIKRLKVATAIDAITQAVVELRSHFEERGAELPFAYEPEIGRFTAKNSDFLAFILAMREIRSIGKRSRDFEFTVAHRLRSRAKGAIHRVGFPRDHRRTRSGLNSHLKSLGFHTPILYGREKDGGLDILWLLPIGAIPHRPVISVQCKNGEYNLSDAHESMGIANSCFARHVGLQQQVYMPCVLFNDYICSQMLPKRPMGFVPLGLTDLAPLREEISVHCI